MKQIPLIIFIAALLAACENDPSIDDISHVNKYIIAQSGGELKIMDSIKLTLPPGSLPNDGDVYLGITGLEPNSLPNPNLELAGSPITIRIPSSSLLKPILLEFPKPTISLDTISTFAFGYSGSTYFSYPYSIEGDKIVITIDKINWESITLKSGDEVTEIIIYLTFALQYPSVEQRGLKKVTIENNGNFIFQLPTVKPPSRVLLLVHGWTGDSGTWDVFLPRIQANSDLNYSEIWTFVYISAYSIKSNAILLKEALQTYANEKQVDIVAHSMGGLVSRSMIEQCGGSTYVNKLITIGTPHEGSPFAVFQYILGALVSTDKKILYNMNTQGFYDLKPDSPFIQNLNQSGSPQLPYYTIASTNDPNALTNSKADKLLSQAASLLLDGEDDGIVQVSSALAIEEATSPDSPIQIPTAWAHLAMPDNVDVFNQVIAYLQEETPSGGTIQDIDGNTYSTIRIGTQTWMAENLKTTKYNDNTNIPFVTTNSSWANPTPTADAYCWYNNDPVNKTTYGALYNWYAVNTGKLCPSGWHVPTHTEWATLRDFLGGADIAGGKIKESGYAHFRSPNVGATNESGFTGLPAGHRYNNGTFAYINMNGYGWSTTEYTTTNAGYIDYRYDNDNFGTSNFPKATGFSVRCLKD